MRSDSFYESKTSCFTFNGIILRFTNPYPILVCQYNLHHTGISISKWRNGQCHMSHRSAQVNLHTRMKQETFLLIGSHHHHVNAERPLIVACIYGAKSIANSLSNSSKQIC